MSKVKKKLDFGDVAVKAPPAPVLPAITSTFHYEHFTAPFFTTNNFNITYQSLDKDEVLSTNIDGNNIHASLKAASDGYRDEYVKLYDSKTARAGLAKANLLNAEIGVLYSEAAPEEGYVGELQFDHFPIRVAFASPKYTFNVTDLFDSSKNFNAVTSSPNKSLRNTDFNKQVQQRIDLAKLHAPFALSKDLTKNLHVHGSQFHETYHHTEQGYMHYLDSTSGTKFVVDKILALNPMYVNALFVDMHSTRYMCTNCNIGIVGFQNTQTQGFLAKVQAQLTKSHIESPTEGLTLNTRVSADMPANNHTTITTTRDIKRRPTITPLDRSLVLQGDSGQAKLKTIIDKKGYKLDDYEGDFFTSREISKKKMEKKLHERF
jgi:hypothetical protein